MTAATASVLTIIRRHLRAIAAVDIPILLITESAIPVSLRSTSELPVSTPASSQRAASPPCLPPISQATSASHPSLRPALLALAWPWTWGQFRQSRTPRARPMGRANYTDAASRIPGTVNLRGGDISGLT
jgi:hypothetical protein